MPIVVAGGAIVLGLLLRSDSELTRSGGNEVRVHPTSATYVPVPINFRQNQPRHWRNIMLAPGR
jgi:hypothetical protein